MFLVVCVCRGSCFVSYFSYFVQARTRTRTRVIQYTGQITIENCSQMQIPDPVLDRALPLRPPRPRGPGYTETVVGQNYTADTQ